MNERHLFRGKRVDNGEWVYGYLYFISVNEINENNLVVIDKARIYSRDEDTVYEVLAGTLGQCTGLRDTDDKPIFEGDIVLYSHPYKNRRCTCQIVYRGGAFIGDGFYMIHHDDPTDIWGEGLEYITVLGNVYDNPELLKLPI